MKTPSPNVCKGGYSAMLDGGQMEVIFEEIQHEANELGEINNSVRWYRYEWMDQCVCVCAIIVEARSPKYLLGEWK